MKKLSFLVPTLIMVGVGLYFLKNHHEQGKDQTQTQNVSNAPVNITSPTEDKEVSKHQGQVGGDVSSNPSTSSATTTAQPVVAEKKEPEKTCFAFEYQHLNDAKSKDIEDFLDYSNAFPILHEGVNAKSICVKVNQKPVPFQVVKNKSKKEEILVGSVVGPESVIRVSYCVGKVACSEACPVAKKRFMDDMMGASIDDDTNVGDDVKSKAKELRALASENKGLNDHSIIREWNTLKKQEWACQK